MQTTLIGDADKAAFAVFHVLSSFITVFNFVAGATYLSAPAETFSAGISYLSAGATQLIAGAETFLAGISCRVAGATCRIAGAETFSAGISYLIAGAERFIAGATQLIAGISFLSAGAAFVCFEKNFYQTVQKQEGKNPFQLSTMKLVR
jgi:hypothetical protein